MIRHQVWVVVVCGAVGIALSFGVVRGADKPVAKSEAKKAPAKPAPIVPPKKGTSETINLFNGKDLEGWEGHKELWSVKDGAIDARADREIKVSTYLLTKRKFSDFRLTCEVKLVKSEIHSGIAIWGHVAPEKKDPYTYMGHLVMFPTGWGMYDLHRRGGLPVDNKPAIAASKGQHEWNQLEILAQGNRIRVVVNGKLVVDYREPELKYIEEAQIGLQLHSNSGPKGAFTPEEIQFKDLVLTTFPEDKLTTLKSN